MFGGEIGDIMSKSYCETSMSMDPKEEGIGSGEDDDDDDRVAFRSDWSISPSLVNRLK